MVLKRVGAVSLAKVMGTLYVFVGLLIGGVFSLISLAGLAAQQQEGPAVFGFLFGAGAVIWIPVVYGLLGFIGALIMAGFYNLVAGMVGGVRLEIE
jgi:hypothetical protein